MTDLDRQGIREQASHWGAAVLSTERVLALLDALETAERERDRLRQEAADQEKRWRKSHEYARISEYRRRAHESERERDRLRAAIEAAPTRWGAYDPAGGLLEELREALNP